MPRLLLRIMLVCLIVPCVSHATTNKPIKWVTDKKFARMVYDAVKDKYPSMEITCRRPILPKNWGATAGVPQEDCLVIAASKTAFFCGEFAYDNGPLPPTQIDCVIVAKSFEKDVKAADILKLTTPRHKRAALPSA